MNLSQLSGCALRHIIEDGTHNEQSEHGLIHPAEVLVYLSRGTAHRRLNSNPTAAGKIQVPILLTCPPSVGRHLPTPSFPHPLRDLGGFRI